MMIGNGGGFYPSPYGQTPYASVPNNFTGGSPSIPPYYGSAYQHQNSQQQSHRHPINQANNGNISSFKLYDLETNAHSEIIRLIFSYARVPYKEKRFKQDEWNETKEQISVSQLPSLRINNQFKIFSLHAIIRYLAREFHLYGTGKHDQAIVDIVLETVRGLQEKIFEQINTPNSSEEKLRQLITDHSSTYLNQLEKLYQIFNRRGAFYLGSHISIADLIVYDTINYLIHIDTKLLENYSHLKEARRRLEKHTQISSYLNAKTKPNKIRNHKSPPTERLATKSPTPNDTSHHHRHRSHDRHQSHDRHRSHDGHKSAHHHHHHHHHRHHHHSKEPTPSSHIKHQSVRSSTKSPSISKKEKEPTPILQTKRRSVRSSKSPSISKKGKETTSPPQTTDVKTPPVITEQKSEPIVN